MQRAQLGFMHNSWFEGINHEFIGYVHPLGAFGVVATSLSYLSFGELDRRDADGNKGKPFRPYDLALVLSYARKFTSDFAMGANLKFLREQIDDKKAQAIAFDFGGRYDIPNSPLTFGVNFQHFGTKVKFIEESFDLPLNLKVGMAYRLLDNSLAIAADLNRPWDNDVNIGLGMEYTPIKQCHLRSGYRYSLGGNDLGAVSGLTAGLGLSIESYQIDYAFVSFGDLGPTHRVSVLANF
jgi:opacity protein-like surface antigen